MSLTLKDLRTAGVRIHFTVAGLNGGRFDIPAQDLERFVADPLAWYAEQYLATREQVERLKHFVDRGRLCVATTKRGTPCQNSASDGLDVTPRDFRPEEGDGRCPVHLRQFLAQRKLAAA